MKSRLGFVSNSSSSSFIVSRKFLSEDQIERLVELCQKPIGNWKDTWEVTVTNDEVSGYTTMRNNYGETDDLEWWMANNRFPMDSIEWEYH